MDILTPGISMNTSSSEAENESTNLYGRSDMKLILYPETSPSFYKAVSHNYTSRQMVDTLVASIIDYSFFQLFNQ